ncbi:hypothetical protein EDD92_4956 [Streptomyces sp. TLI_185]|nr:hypothetical protein EDD92_4956 [Streptomyces sp. TLI_185]
MGKNEVVPEKVAWVPRHQHPPVTRARVSAVDQMLFDVLHTSGQLP